MREDFERDIAIQRRIACPVHQPHPAFANEGGDFVDAEAGTAGNQRQTAESIAIEAGTDQSPASLPGGQEDEN